MYICLCRGVTDSAIRQAVDEGVRSYKELSRKTGCGTECGTCVDFTRSLLDEALRSTRIEAPQGLRLTGVCSPA
jgi:bacterioferritin-associated ferredoxin